MLMTIKKFELIKYLTLCDRQQKWVAPWHFQISSLAEQDKTILTWKMWLSVYITIIMKSCQKFYTVLLCFRVHFAKFLWMWPSCQQLTDCPYDQGQGHLCQNSSKSLSRRSFTLSLVTAAQLCGKLSHWNANGNRWTDRPHTPVFSCLFTNKNAKLNF